MENNAVISIVSNASMEDGELIEVVSPGRYIEENGVYKAVYEETKISGMEGTTTTLEIENEKVTLIREGATEARMIFDYNDPTVSLYSTPYGSLQISILTRKLDVDVNDKGGKIDIDYEISIGGDKPQKTNLSLKISAR